MAKILEGRTIKADIAQKLAVRVATLATKPRLAVIQVGDRQDSSAYIRAKKLFGEKIGVEVAHKQFPENAAQTDIIAEVKRHNLDPQTTGIIVQIPLPEAMDVTAIIEAIDPKKDVDGLTAVNFKKLIDRAHGGFVPATTRGIMEMLSKSGVELSGKRAVVVGRSSLVGKPTALALLNADATVTVCHSKTRNLAEITRTADVLIVATGKAGLIGRDHVKAGQVVIDVGINTVANEKLQEEVGLSRLVGDVDFAAVSEIVSAITPVPGGVGQMTVAALFENVVEAAEKRG